LGDSTPGQVAISLPQQPPDLLEERAIPAALARDYKNVHTDVQALLELGLLEKDERGGLRAPFDEIVIRAGLRKAA
jgi:predicted transcriptional regulator